jgi:hypothetical protein
MQHCTVNNSKRCKLQCEAIEVRKEVKVQFPTLSEEV